MKRRIMAFLILAAFLAGCRICPTDTSTENAVVTGIRIVHYLGDHSEERQYQTEENMSMVLTYLRLLKTVGVPEEDPMAEGGGVYHITLSLSDGREIAYAQKADRYLWQERFGWRLIDEDQAPQLGQLFRALPSDTAPIFQAPSSARVMPFQNARHTSDCCLPWSIPQRG